MKTKPKIKSQYVVQIFLRRSGGWTALHCYARLSQCRKVIRESGDGYLMRIVRFDPTVIQAPKITQENKWKLTEEFKNEPFNDK